MAKASDASGPMLTDWQDGDHLILWYKTAEGRTRAIAEFLIPGMNGNTLIAIILPLRELEDLEKYLKKDRFPVDRLLEESRLLFFASEEILPINSSDCEKIGIALFELHKKAEEQGRDLILVGRVAPILFEQGEVSMAMEVEKTADLALGKARLLCLYDASNLKNVKKRDIERIDAAHTHVLHEVDGGNVRMTKGRNSRNSGGSEKRKNR